MHILRYLIVGLTLLPIILLGSLQLLALNYSWYEIQFNQLNLYQKIDRVTADAQVNNLFLYLNSQAEINNHFYTEKELLHLADVKNLINLTRIVNTTFLILLALELTVILLFLKFFELVKTLLFANLVVLFLFLPIGAMLIMAFDPLFLLFHQVFFNNDYWLLDPSIHSLVVIFPPELFGNLTKQIIFTAIAFNLLGIVVSSILFNIIKVMKIIVK